MPNSVGDGLLSGAKKTSDVTEMSMLGVLWQLRAFFSIVSDRCHITT